MEQDICGKMNGPPGCSKCNKPIFDGTILQVRGRFMHTSCVQCAICRKFLTGSCHVKDNNVYCRDDFVRLFGAKCAGCKKIISPTECVHVVNEHVYHTTCFTCSMCTCKLHPGNYFYLRDDGGLVCALDYRTMAENRVFESDSESDESGSDDAYPNQALGNIHDNQLRMLLDAYRTNPRPNKSIRRQLSQQTGLKPRAIQVWFQNKRSQDRQFLRRQRTHEATNNSFKEKAGLIYESGNQNVPYSLARGLQGQNGNYHVSGDKTQREATHTGSYETRPEVMDMSCESSFDSYQLYCPLDFLIPDEMPPNVDLSSADICNGEVITSKQTTGRDKCHVTSQITVNNNSCSWLTL